MTFRLLSGLAVALVSLTFMVAAGDRHALAQPPSDELIDVALDPGHSSWDVGATGGGLREFELTLDVAQRVRPRLEAMGYRVRLTREDNQRVAPSVPADLTEATRVEQFAATPRRAAPGSTFRSTSTV